MGERDDRAKLLESLQAPRRPESTLGTPATAGGLRGPLAFLQAGQWRKPFGVRELICPPR